ncbi:MAG: amidohydrolase family protein [Ardenticatenaceae bacterium]|nr:amidohydrolase family protein [Ardenticatenaceae bacterium]
MFDLLIKNGTIIDGRKTPRFVADVGVVGDRITAVGDLASATAHTTLDAAGHIVAPGFIDVHTHSDAWLLKQPNFLSKTLQGFTTEFLMLDGIAYAPVNQHTIAQWLRYLLPLNGLRFEEYIGWESIAEYMALLDGNVAQNVATFIPYANVRTLACGFGQKRPDDYQMSDIKYLIQQGMEQGAMGLSNGLDYVDEAFATTAELVAAAQAMAAARGIYVTHVRYQLGTLEGVKEAVAIGKRAGVPVHISHLKGSTAAEAEAILHYLDTVAIHEVDFSFDVYPYVSSSTMLQYLLPHEVWSDGPLALSQKLVDPRIRTLFGRELAERPLDHIHIAWVKSKGNSHHQGQTLAQYITAVQKSPTDALCDLLIEEAGAVLLVFGVGADELVHPFLAHSHYMMGSDGIFHADGAVHPRQFGSAARLVGPCVRDHRLFSLEGAVYKMTAFPAQRFGLRDRGVIENGRFADITIFNPHTITDTATYTHPHQYAVGVTHVIVNGVPIIREGQAADLHKSFPGRYLRYQP